MAPPRILIDRCVENYALTAEGAVQTKTLKWGPHSIDTAVHGYRGKELPTAQWPRRQIEALPTLARLAREGDLVFCTSVELKFESLNAARGWQGFIGDLFRDIEYEHVPAAIERSYFSQTIDVGKHASGEAQASWYKDFLLTVNESELLRQLKNYDALPDFDRRNIANLGRFREICEYLDTDDHIRDAFHLWTAEVNGLDYFLTVDKRFINKMTYSTRLDLPTPPIGPASLVERLGIKELDRLPLPDSRFGYLFQPDD